MADAIRTAHIFLTQLEMPVEIVERGMKIARDAGVTTILNPAPAPPAPLPDSLLALADYVVPNETRGRDPHGPSCRNRRAGRARGRRAAAAWREATSSLRSERVALWCARPMVTSTIVDAFNAGPVLETTGAGDAFCGGFAAALAEDMPLLDAVRFGCATAGISVTRHGTAPSMPKRAEIDALLTRG